jgi:hypothetical protein
MTETKKTRVMTAKRFATSKLSGKATAEGFLAAHAAFLRGHTFLEPILDAYDTKQLLPTPTLQAVQSALLTHVLESEMRTAEAKMAARKEQDGKPKKERKPKGEKADTPAKPYSITLMCKVYNRELTTYTIEVGTVEEITGYKIRTDAGDIEVASRELTEGHVILETFRETYPAVYDADTYGEASRLADRRLFQRGDSVFAVIRNNYDRPIDTVVQRGDAIARMLKSPKGAVSKTSAKSTKTLGFQPHAKQTRVTGPWSHR